MTKRVRKFMIEDLKARSLCWEIPGPKDTGIETLQCWLTPGSRLVIVEIYNNDNGFDVFPQILRNGIEETVQIVQNLASLEKSF